MIYARIQGGVVAETFSPPADVPISNCFAPSLIWIDCTATPGVAPGWSYDGAAFHAPAAPAAPSLAQQAATALSAGLNIISTSTPALNGIYACDAAAQQNFANVLLYTMLHATFPNGTTNFEWFDKAGGAHVCPSIAEFQALATAVANYVSAITLVILSGSGSLPASTVTIA